LEFRLQPAAGHRGTPFSADRAAELQGAFWRFYSSGALSPEAPSGVGFRLQSIAVEPVE
jgi:hypothetical protein